MTSLRVAAAGIGVWTPRLDGWSAFRRHVRRAESVHEADGDANNDADAAADDDATATRARPAPMLLPAAERRRVPDGVAVALESAREALDGSMQAGVGAFDAHTLASVFASAHGELAIVDYLCRTLAEDPLLLSPTRFHHSVHNAAAGYWGIATQSVGPSTSLAAGDETFAAALLEAATQVAVEARPVLLVVFDTPTTGLLTRAAPNTALFGAALLLMPDAHDAPLRLSLAVEARPCDPPLPHDPDLRPIALSSPAARAVALLEALARDDDAVVLHPLHPEATLSVSVFHAAVAGRMAATRIGEAPT